MDVIYLCDKKACKKCNEKTKYCTRTTDIKHAINFEEIAPGHFMEIPVPTSLDFAMSPEEFEKRMSNLVESHQKRLGLEVTHIFMDELMCKVLREFGYSGGVDIFNEYREEICVKEQRNA